jgi:hypothetical protein
MTTTKKSVQASDKTQYGCATNGMEVGNGFDCVIVRESARFAIVNIMTPSGSMDELGVLDVEPDTDLQELAVECANCPGDVETFNGDSDEWDELAERWNAIEVVR